MSRATSSALKAAVLAANMPDAVLEFMDIASTEIATLHLVNNAVDVIKDGVTYQACGFYATLPIDKEGDVSAAQVIMDAVDLSIIQMIRTVTKRLQITITVALASDPDASPEVVIGTFELSNVEYDEQSISGDLTYADPFTVVMPSLHFTPVTTPGVF